MNRKNSEKRPAHRPAIAVRLADIEPGMLAACVGNLVRKHVESLGDHLGPILCVEVTGVSSDGDSAVGRCAERLTSYAKTGNGVTRDIRADVYHLRTAMRSSAAGLPGEYDDQATLPPAVALVLRAAIARADIATGLPVTAADLATVADITQQQVRLLARVGKLTIKDGKITAARALKWLRARGVEGYR